MHSICRNNNKTKHKSAPIPSERGRILCIIDSLKRSSSILLLSFQDVRITPHTHRVLPWAKKTIGLSARCGCVIMTRAHILQTTPVARYCTIHNRSISLANSSPENDHILQRTVTMVVIHRSLLDAINHIKTLNDLAKHSITAIQMGHTTIFYIVLLHH